MKADTLKKLGIAPNNETYIIGILRFIGVLDGGGNKTSQGRVVFTKHNAEDFQKGLRDLVESSYKELFALHARTRGTFRRAPRIEPATDATESLSPPTFAATRIADSADA